MKPLLSLSYLGIALCAIGMNTAAMENASSAQNTSVLKPAKRTLSCAKDRHKNTRPTADFSYETTDFTVSFDGSFSSDRDNDPLSYSWDFDGVVADGPTAIYTFPGPGSYKVTLSVSDGKTTHARVKELIVGDTTNRAPEARFYYSTSSLSVVLDAFLSDDRDRDDLTYTWDINGEIQSGSFVEYSFANPGSYDVTLTVFDGLQSDSVTQRVTVNQGTRPNETPWAGMQWVSADFGVSFSARDSTFDEDGDPLTYRWYIDGQTKSGSSFVYEFPGLSRYDVTVVVSDGIDSSSWTDTVRLIATDNIRPEADFSYSTDGLSIDVDASLSSDYENDSLTYTWDFGGTTAHGINATHTFPGPGSYDVTLVVYDGLRESRETKPIVIGASMNTAPLAQFSYFSTGLNVEFNDLSSDLDDDLLSYSWDFGDGSTAAIRFGVVHTYAQAGEYTVTLTVSDGAESNSFSKTISVSELENTAPFPVINAIDEGLAVSFDGSYSYDYEDDPLSDYVWDFGDGSTATGVGAVHEYATPGVYTVTLTVSDGKTTGSATHLIRINPPR